MNVPAAPVETSALELEGLTVRLGSETILEDVSFRLASREYLAILGPNGAGKSVLLKTILGEYTPCAGSVRVFGKPPRKARGLVAYVPQFAEFDPEFPIRVRDVVLTGRLHQTGWVRRYSRADRAIAEGALERMRIAELAERPMYALSGGQRQRVLIARALAAQSPLLLLDEPTASLDVTNAGNLYDLLGSLAKDHAIVLVTHDMGMVSRHVDRVACLSRRLVHHGDPNLSAEVLTATYGHSFVPVVHDHHDDGDHHPPSPR